MSDGAKTVFVVDRDRHLRALITRFLDEAGYAVEFADDGPAALDRVRILRPCVVISEILVPKLDGLALCQQLKQDPETQHIPVIIFSMLAASQRAQRAGADGFLLKPLEKTRFLDTLRRHAPPAQ